MASIILQRLRGGVPNDQIRSAWEPRATLIYAITAIEIVAAIILSVVTGFRYSAAAFVALPLWAALLAFGGMLMRRTGHPKVGGTMELTALVYGQGFAILFLLFPLTALSGPFQDGLLASVDRYLGFDWVAFANLFRNSPTLVGAMVIIYKSFEWQPLLIIALLMRARLEDRAWVFVGAAALSSAIIALIYPFVPADGAFIHFGITPSEFPAFRGDSPWHFGPILHLIKDQGVRLVIPSLFTGMVSFPSYHAAAAVMFSWAVWPLRWRWAFIALNVAMAISALIVGAHYLVDILAGAMIGAFFTWILPVIRAPMLSR